jgi:hypothetical protein
MYFVGTRFFGGTATWGEVLRTLGFAQAPGVLLVLSFIPIVGGILALVVRIWILVSSFIAIRQALDIDNTKTAFTVIIGIVAFGLVYAVFLLVLGLIFVAGAAVGGAARP